jgi:cytochrome c-type biogenesis protein CcmH/NrfG
LEDKLVDARYALAVGDYRRAASGYTALIRRKYQLDEVTSELELALDRNPKAAPLWQVLGDAYMKNDRLPDAITAYERGIAAA